MRTILTAALLGLAATAAAQPTGHPRDLMPLVEAERAFARMAPERGVKESFLAFLHPESVLFRPDPVNGVQATSERPGAPGLLKWRPVWAEVSTSGDLGMTTGPSTYQDSAGAEPVWHGYYTSVWQKDRAGRWKLLLDVGTDNPPPAERTPESFDSTGVGEPARTFDVPAAVAEAELLNLDEALTAALASPDDLRALAAPRFRLHRNGVAPRVGIGEAAAHLNAGPQRLRSQTLGLGVARSGDFAYTYGSFRPHTGEAGRGHYIRLWRRNADGRWQATLDVQVPRPE